MSTPDVDRQLEDLARALREDAPQPDPTFVHEMDRRVEARFAKPRRFRLPALHLAWRPALGVAAAALIAVVVAIAIGGGESHGPIAGKSVTADTARDAAGAPAAGAQSSTSASVRHVERSAELTIAAPADKLQEVADGIGQVAETHGGYVVSSNISTGADSTRSGTFVLRVPSKQLETALGELGRLGTVRARSESSQDMTAPYRGTQDRLANALLERRATRDQLARVTGTSKEAAVRAHLRALNAEIGDLSGRMKNLRTRTVFSTVTVTLEQRHGAGVAPTRSGPGKALHDALRTLSGALELAIRVLGVLLPFALLGALAWLGGGALRRRRREAALF